MWELVMWSYLIDELARKGLIERRARPRLHPSIAKAFQERNS